MLLAALLLIPTYLFPLGRMTLYPNQFPDSRRLSFGAAGVMPVKFFGGAVRAHAALLAGGLLWGIVPILVAQRLLWHQDI